MDAYCKKDRSGLSPDQNQLLVQHHIYNYLHHPQNYQAGPASFQQVPQIGLQAAGLYALGGIGPGTLEIWRPVLKRFGPNFDTIELCNSLELLTTQLKNL